MVMTGCVEGGGSCCAESLNCELYGKCVDYLKSLIEIPSPSGEEEQVACFIESKLVSFGWDVRRIPTVDGRFALYGEMSGGLSGSSLLLAGHIDTVAPVVGWDTDPFSAIFKDAADDATGAISERLYGLGSCDMKAGVAIMIAMAELAAERRGDLPGVLKLAFLPDEEAYSVGVRALIESGVSADFCLMPEPHFTPAIVGAPGKMLIKLSAQGKSAHGARPWEGINAISEMSSLLASLDGLNFQSYENMAAQPLVPLSIKGGYEKYSLSVPDSCSCVISKQLVPGETKESVLDMLNALIERLSLKAAFSIEVIPPYYPPYIVNTDIEELRLFESVYLSKMGHELAMGFGSSVSDANCLSAESGIPVLVFGPYGRNYHQANEWVDTESIKRCLDLYTEYIFHKGRIK